MVIQCNFSSFEWGGLVVLVCQVHSTGLASCYFVWLEQEFLCSQVHRFGQLLGYRSVGSLEFVSSQCSVPVPQLFASLTCSSVVLRSARFSIARCMLSQCCLSRGCQVTLEVTVALGAFSFCISVPVRLTLQEVWFWCSVQCWHLQSHRLASCEQYSPVR